jgi:hypothetical protein
LRGALRAPDDPTVRPARLLPENLEELRSLGREPGPGERAIFSGIRISAFPDGAMFAAADRLPSPPSTVVVLPPRLGGGFLFVLGAHLWRAAGWLTRATPIATFSWPIAQVQIGLDRVYVRSPQGAMAAVDPRDGAHVDLGPLPASPTVSRLAAIDAWRAVAIADLRGALMTLDAGSTWRPLGLPIDPSEIVTMEYAFAVGGLDENRQMQWWEVQPDGQTGRMASSPVEDSRADRSTPWPSCVDVLADAGGAATGPRRFGEPPTCRPLDPVARAFGRRPLLAALEDGWPLTDGTAVVARDGVLGRVRLSDGALVESAADAFALKPARCHPLNLSSATAKGAFGFVCGEPRGRTLVVRWDEREARLVELRRFDSPRQVLAFGNGALAVRGPCAATDQPATARAADEQVFCVMRRGGGWAEMHFRGEDVDLARIVVLGEGRVALVRPPIGGDLSSAQLTITDGTSATHLPLAFPPLRSEVSRALRLGVWLDGFEERHPGVLGGWVDVAGSVVGIEIGTGGEVRVGEYIRDAGAPIVSGRWGLGWTASRRGFETTDGGMTWTKDLELPDPIAPSRAVHERVCGPVGCVAAGWMRVGWGWGAGDRNAPAEPPPSLARSRYPPALDLDCQGAAGSPEETKQPQGQRSSFAPTAALGPRFGSAVSVSTNAHGLLGPFPTFHGHPGPTVPPEDAGLVAEATTAFSPMSELFARVHAWGPKNGDWEQLGRWEIAWLWPWGGWTDVRSSLAVHAPWTSVDAARRALAAPPVWGLAAGDDPDHALLIGRRSTGSEAIVLESGRAPVEVHRLGGEPLAEVESAVRVGDRWFLSTSQAYGELAATVVWLLDGQTAREVARIPRSRLETRTAARLARRADGRALGLVVDGHPEAERGAAMRWIVAIDLEAGVESDPEPLAPADLSDRPVSLCTGEDAGWVIDLPFPGTLRLHGLHLDGALAAPLARMRLTRERACLEHLLGSVDAMGALPREALTRAAGQPYGRGDTRTIDVCVTSARMRYLLRCSSRP